MRYDLTDPHPLLSAKAKAMLTKDAEQFQAQVEIAETYLQLAVGTLYTGDKATLVKHFLALQVNWQIQLGMDPYYIRTISSSHTSQSTTYKDNPIISPLVSAGFFALMRTWGFQRTVRSIRG